MTSNLEVYGGGGVLGMYMGHVVWESENIIDKDGVFTSHTRFVMGEMVLESNYCMTYAVAIMRSRTHSRQFWDCLRKKLP